MDTPRPYKGVALRLGLFAAGLLVVFAAAVGIGSLFDPADTESDAGHGDAGHGAGHPQQGAAGPATAEDGYSLRLEPGSLGRGEEGVLRFTIAAAGGTVKRFDELHERRMHLIVVRRDGSGFQHLHPEMDGSGTWSVPIELAEPGPHRAFADFAVGGEQHTLADDFAVSGGEYEPRPFPAPASLDSTGRYEVRLRAADLRAGGPSSLRFAVSRGGEEVADLAPYLGAKGHLVVLREGDLAFLHVHPEETGGGHGHGHGAHGSAPPGEIAFAASFPTAGRYRLYLQFRHEGVVRTAEFTVEVPR